MTSQKICIAGVGMIPFKKPGQSDSYDIMGANAAREALHDAGITYDKIEQVVASFVYGDSCAGQAAMYHVGITGVPIFNVNNNCSSGSSAFYLACQAIKSGMVDVAMAVGFEQMAPGAVDIVFPDRPSPLSRHETAVADLLGLSGEERNLPPAIMLFGCQAEVLMNEYGVSDVALAKIAVKARAHAANSPYAIFRDPLTVDDILADPPHYRGLRKLFACPPSCGAAAAIVCSENYARKHGLNDKVIVAGQGACSDFAEFMEEDVLDVMFRGLSRVSAERAYEDAGIGPEEVDVVELHDCFTSNEAITYGALGLCPEDSIEKFIEDGDNTYGGKVVVCPSGGLLSKGHPLGATGLAQITELVWQLRGTAGPRQVDGARVALQHNGGLGSAGFVNILQVN